MQGKTAIAPVKNNFDGHELPKGGHRELSRRRRSGLQNAE
jgi:hypothetical protein